MNFIKNMSTIQRENDFSGTICVKNSDQILVEESYGYANRSDQIKNTSATRFGIASGCKLFTAIAICQLVDEEKLSFESKLTESLDINFKYFNKDITVHHLLTHTSGVPDYFDEEVMDDFEELWIKNPMYHFRKLVDFLPLFQDEVMKFQPGERFHYNNAGYILLGLIVEKVSKQKCTDYVHEHIFKKAGMIESGYFSFDTLPANTALGYIHGPEGTWTTNIYSLPVVGGSDGGAYITVHDMVKLWEALRDCKLLSESITEQLLTPHVQEDDHSHYGYGVWIEATHDEVYKYHVMGYDPGVSFHSAYYPASDSTVVVCSNKSEGAFEMMRGIEEEMKEG